MLDRISMRMRQPIMGDIRIVLAKELDRAVPVVAACPSTATAAVAAEREAQRIAASLHTNGPMFRDLIAEELANVAHPHAG